MRLMLSTLIFGIPGMALGHPGHIVEVAGHNHWIALGAIGAAALAALWSKLKDKEEGEDDADDPEELEEEAA